MERNIQNEIRLALGQGNTKLFRNNVGMAWTGEVVTLKNGDKLIKNPRPVHFGLVEGSSDLVGFTSVTVTPEMVGRKVAIFTAVEVKQPGKTPTPTQRNFIAQVRENGGRAGVATDVNSARLICQGV